MPLSDDRLNEFMNNVWNVWFRKWRTQMTTETNFDAASTELLKLIEQEHPITRHMAISLLYELRARLDGSYTEYTKDKLLHVIEGSKYGA